MLCGLLDARRGRRGGARRRLPRRCRTPAAASASCSTPPRSTAAAAGARRSPSPRRRWASTSAASTSCSRSSGSTARAARKRVRQYSLGMRQRLGLAHALLGDPEVLILDEPANGLDPEGMRWMRGLLRDFADRGGTVLLSSHLLYEVEAVADQLVIIGAGRIVAQGDARGAAGRRRHARARGDEPTRCSPRSTPRGSTSAPARRRRLRRRRRARRGRPRRARRRRRAHPPRPSESAGLEQLFFDLTSGAERPPTSWRPSDEHRRPSRARAPRAAPTPAPASAGSRSSSCAR